MNINFELIAEPECGIAIDSSSTEYDAFVSHDRLSFTKRTSVIMNVVYKKVDSEDSDKSNIQINNDYTIDCETLDHEDPTEVTHHQFKDGDGTYLIDHFIIPNKAWFDDYQSATGPKVEFANIIYYDNGELHDESGNIIPIKDFLDTYENGRYSVAHARSTTFNMCGLHECYFHIAMKLLSEAGPCNSAANAELIYKRDLVWMGINVINYLLDEGKYPVAEEILKKLEECNGVCSHFVRHKPFKNCGCHK